MRFWSSADGTMILLAKLKPFQNDAVVDRLSDSLAQNSDRTRMRPNIAEDISSSLPVLLEFRSGRNSFIRFKFWQHRQKDCRVVAELFWDFPMGDETTTPQTQERP